MRQLVEQHGLGEVVDPHDPLDIARGIRAILDRPPAEREALRERCRRLAEEQFNWETGVQPYLALVARLVPSAGNEDRAA
jgi:glycosyltransferase involved in cell wall biosynthesis